jgi:hypothetical protein
LLARSPSIVKERPDISTAMAKFRDSKCRGARPRLLGLGGISEGRTVPEPRGHRAADVALW